MDSDLVRTSREEIDFEECVFIMIVSLIEKLRFSDLWIDRIMYSHLFPIVRVSSDIGLDISFMIFYFSYYECEVGLFDRALCDLELERVHRFVVLRDDDRT